MSYTDEIKKAWLKNSLRPAAKAAMMGAAITGECTMKMTMNPDTNEIEFEILNPFKGCECDAKFAEGWVCENHEDVAWNCGDGCCGGAGVHRKCKKEFEKAPKDD